MGWPGATWDPCPHSPISLPVLQRDPGTDVHPWSLPLRQKSPDRKGLLAGPTITTLVCQRPAAATRSGESPAPQTPFQRGTSGPHTTVSTVFLFSGFYFVKGISHPCVCRAPSSPAGCSVLHVFGVNPQEVYSLLCSGPQFEMVFLAMFCGWESLISRSLSP